MKLKAIATTSLIVAMAVGRADTVYADADGLVGGIIGGIIGGAIVNEANKSNRRTTTVCFTIGARAMKVEPAADPDLPQFVTASEAATEAAVIATPAPGVAASTAPGTHTDIVIAIDGLAAPAGAVAATVAQVVIMAARLPFLLFDN